MMAYDGMWFQRQDVIRWGVVSERRLDKMGVLFRRGDVIRWGVVSERRRDKMGCCFGEETHEMEGVVS
jgi:hypothetical protein